MADDCGFKNDWAILILDRRLGDELGFLGAKLPEQGKNYEHFHVGYPGDKENGLQMWRSPHKENMILEDRSWGCDHTGPFFTRTDSMGGQSGGARWQVDDDGKPYVWGTLSVGLAVGSDAVFGWASGNRMMDGINRARSEYP